jgi:hypothetical protein
MGFAITGSIIGKLLANNGCLPCAYTNSVCAAAGSAFKGVAEMAMATCLECGAEVSASVKTCPTCGIANPVKRMSFGTGFAVVLVIVTAISASFGRPEHDVERQKAERAEKRKEEAGRQKAERAEKSKEEAARALEKRAQAETERQKDNALDSLKIESLNWRRGGFNTTILMTVKFQNTGKHNVKDIELGCGYFSKSGTLIGTSSKVIFDIVPAGYTLSIADFNMGLIHSQAESVRCWITNLLVMPRQGAQ